MSDWQRRLNVRKKIKIWWLQMLISFRMDRMEECKRQQRAAGIDFEVHRIKRNNLEAKLQRAWYE